MAKKSCSICDHVERRRIELRKAHGATLDQLAAEFNVHRQALWRHWQEHVTPEARMSYLAGGLKLAELKDRASAENLSLLDYLSILRSSLLEHHCRASEAGAGGIAAQLAGRLLETLRQIGQLTGEVQRYVGSVNIENNISIHNEPGYALLEATLLEALLPHPAARADVLAALHRLEQQSKPLPPLIEARPVL